jgi:histidinol-phosphate aminotransferase
MDEQIVEELIKTSAGIVVIDEAYIDFSSRSSWMERLDEFPNLVVMQTFSKAYGLAAIRLGIGFASEEIVSILNKIKPPYNVNELTQRKALAALQNRSEIQAQIEEILYERERLRNALSEMKEVEKVYPSDANFLLVKMDAAIELYRYLVERGVVVRNRSSVVESSLRFTIGTPAENKILITEIQSFYS